MSPPDLAIDAVGLTKSFGSTAALCKVDLAVEAGTICGLLGPNGAGKSTLVRILATLTVPDSGRARVGGYDVVACAGEVRRHIGLVGQQAAVDQRISGRDNLRMFGRLHHLPERDARARADELLAELDLSAAADRLVSTYSGGMRRRLDLAASVITSPSVLFLDEPTTGLDPRSRAEMWARIRSLVAEGTTVLLTTQYLDEADQLADQIVIVDDGEVIGRGRPAELKAMVGTERLEIVVRDRDQTAAAATALERVLRATADVVPGSGRIGIPASGSETVVSALVELGRLQIATDDIGLRRPTLDDVFLRLTGHRTAAAAATAELTR
jgi:ABC-2 type transport system ATP-binding protein